jgi:O-acetyl-ADP-ribose deacetylase (regulator of RNase III)
MNQSERREFLIRALLAENPRYSAMDIPEDEQGQREMLRALCNVRPPMPVGEEFLAVQDAYLQEEVSRAGVVDGDALPTVPGDHRLVLWRGDITTLRVDAIVNAANSGLTGCYQPLHNCIDNIIHTKSGVQLRLACADLMNEQGHDEPTGQAKLTPAYNLPCRYVLHTVGPIVDGSLTDRHREALASCYRSCFQLAAEQGLHSVAFCCISTGVFRFPNQEAAEVAVSTVRQLLQTPSSIQKVIFNVFQDIDQQIYRSLLGAD